MRSSVDMALPWQYSLDISAHDPFDAHTAGSMISSAFHTTHLSGLSTLGCTDPSFPDEILKPLPTHPVFLGSCFQHTL